MSSPSTDKRRIGFVTTARSDYGTMRPVMKAAKEDPSITPLIYCGGMHLLTRFGDTYRQLEADGLEIDERIPFFSEQDTPLGLGQALGTCISTFTEALLRTKPDLIVVPGDRIEALAVLTAATAQKLPVAHLCGGGDITEGALDDQIRHAMTKLSHLHFVATKTHARRVIQMGEEPWRVTVTGETALDVIRNFSPLSRRDLHTSAGIPEDAPIALCTFHPQTVGDVDFARQFLNILEVLENGWAVPVLTYPNVDPGFERILDAMRSFCLRRKDAIVVRSFTATEYCSVMAHAVYMIGNSSSGILEAPSFGLPCVNVGERQAGRERGRNVIDVSGNDVNEIRVATERAASESFRDSLRSRENPYGDGHATMRVIDVLKRVPLGDRLLRKKFHELSQPIDSDPNPRAR